MMTMNSLRFRRRSFFYLLSLLFDRCPVIFIDQSETTRRGRAILSAKVIRREEHRLAIAAALTHGLSIDGTSLK